MQIQSQIWNKTNKIENIQFRKKQSLHHCVCSSGTCSKNKWTISVVIISVMSSMLFHTAKCIQIAMCTYFDQFMIVCTFASRNVEWIHLISPQQLTKIYFKLKLLVYFFQRWWLWKRCCCGTGGPWFWTIYFPSELDRKPQKDMKMSVCDLWSSFVWNNKSLISISSCNYIIFRI